MTLAVPTDDAGRAAAGIAPIVEGRGLCRMFGRVEAVRDIDVQVGAGEVVALVGANGAGKTTLLNLLSGAVSVTAGTVEIDGNDVTSRDMSVRTHLGLVRTFQLARVVPQLTVLENVMLGAAPHGALGALRLSEERRIADRAAEALSLTDVARERWMRRASEVPPPERRWLEFARVIAASPRVALLDEPSSGMSRGETERLGALVRRLVGEWGAGVLLVTHDVSLAAKVGDRILVMDHGRALAAGDIRTVLESEEVMAAYLGVRTAATLKETLRQAAL
jgi:ABC-type branched-subunit amino acid transport system ATPase component